jgi:multiple sugar transport system substrate-binding protein
MYINGGRVMLNMKKVLAIILSLTIVLVMFAGCDNKNSDSDTQPQTQQDSGENNDNEPVEKKKVVIDVWNKLNDECNKIALEEVQKLEKYSNVEFDIRDKDAEYLTKMPIAIASGEQRDIIAIFNPIEQAKYARAQTILPLDDIIEEIGWDFEDEYGIYTENCKIDGKIVMVPEHKTFWVLYYNKKIFDDAGVPYPSADVPMTWDEYAELAKRLTSGEGANKIYGALHLTWPMFWYAEAIQKLGGGEHFYNEEGLSNIEDPIFAKCLERTYKMMHVDKSIPTYADISISKTSAQAWMNGQYAMYLQGNWLLSWAIDKEQYPRDFEIGIAPVPVDEGTQVKSWGVINGWGIGQTSADPELSLEILRDISRTAAKYTLSQVDVNQKVEQENLFVGMGEKLGSEGLTEEVLKKAFADPNALYVTEKVTGPNNAEYEKVITEEVEKYFVKEQDLETTIANIKKRGDKVIQSQ